MMKFIALSTVLTVKTGSTGPKTFCCIIGSVSATSVKIVGATKKKYNIINCTANVCIELFK